MGVSGRRRLRPCERFLALDKVVVANGAFPSSQPARRSVRHARRTRWACLHRPPASMAPSPRRTTATNVPCLHPLPSSRPERWRVPKSTREISRRRRARSRPRMRPAPPPAATRSPSGAARPPRTSPSRCSRTAPSWTSWTAAGAAASPSAGRRTTTWCWSTPRRRARTPRFNSRAAARRLSCSTTRARTGRS